MSERKCIDCKKDFKSSDGTTQASVCYGCALKRISNGPLAKGDENAAKVMSGTSTFLHST